MIRKKQNGSALIIMLFVITLLLVLGTSLVEVYTSTYKTEINYDSIKRVNLLAESGAEVGISKVIKEKKCDNSITNLTLVTNNITCDISFQTGSGTAFGTITSTAHDLNSKHSKTVTVVLNKTTPTPSTNSGSLLTHNCINMFGDNFNFGNGSDKQLTSNGSIYLQSNLSSTISLNLNVNKGNLTIISNGTVNFNNTGTTSYIYGDTYVKSVSGFIMNQTLNITNGGLTVDNGTGDIDFTNNGNNVNINGNVSLQSTSNIYLDKYFKIGNSSNNTKSNLIVNAGGSIDLGAAANQGKDITNDLYVSSNNTNNSVLRYTQFSGISNNTVTNVSGMLTLNSGKDIINNWGYNNKISGDYYAKANGNIEFDSNPNLCIYNGNYTVIAGKMLTDKSNYSNPKTYIKSGGIVGVNNRGLLQEPTAPTEPSQPSLPSNTSATNPYKIGNVINNSAYNYNSWYTPQGSSDLECIKIDNTNNLGYGALIQAIDSESDNKYKIILIKGNFTISGDFNKWINSPINIDNTIIYCSGKFTIDNTVNSEISSSNPTSSPVNFNHSVVYSNSFENQNINTIMTAIDQTRLSTDTFNTPFTDKTTSEVNTFLSANLDGTYTKANLTDSGSAGSSSSTSGGFSIGSYN
mgnify:CR=1 FL=1